MPYMVRNEEALSDHQLRALAPAIFAEQEHDSRSDRYAFVPTSAIVGGLRKEGFQPVWAAACKTRSVDRKSHSKHMIRFRREGELIAGSIPEVVLVNSHDGSSSYQLHAGAFRFICANGMIVPEGMAHVVRVKHTGNILDNVIEGSFTVVKEADEALQEASEWQGIALKPDVQEAFAEMALHARFGTSEEDPRKADTNVTVQQMLRARRVEDRDHQGPFAKRDVFTTFQVLQENAMKGGIPNIDPETRRRRRTRPVQGIDQTVGVNKQLAFLAKMFADKFGG